MPRMARIKSEEGGPGWYHVYARTAGIRGDFPLGNRLCRRKLLGFIELFSRVYYCRVAGFCIMGNHYHLVIYFEERCEVDRQELYQRASILYSKEFLDEWSLAKWERFEERVFDLSEYMRNVQAAFARWFNQSFERRGRFWADRFKSTLLEDEESAMDCLIYVELNPVRAGIVERPERYDGSSIYYRQAKKDRWLTPLSALSGVSKRRVAVRDYRARIYYRGNVIVKERQAIIPTSVLHQEKARGFEDRGVFGKRLRYFVDGLVLGCEEYVRQQLVRMRVQGRYLRRCNPIRQLGGLHMTLREQRSNAVAF